MFHLLSIELIGNPRQGFSPAWVKEVIGIDADGLITEHLEGQMDYSKANSVGSRGVYRHYFLQEGIIYHVSSPKTWNRTDEYYCCIRSGAEIRMTYQEAIKWATNDRWD
jgi:hypothetical protein